MTTRTRYFVIVSLGVLATGLGAGLVAYYVGLPTGALSPQEGLAELRLVPKSASVVAYADVAAVMNSELSEKVRQAWPDALDGRDAFERQTGIDIQTDVDRVVAFVAGPPAAGQEIPASTLMLVRGRFNETRIEALMRDHGARLEEYKGRRVIITEPPAATNAPAPPAADGRGRTAVALAFIEPGLTAVGSATLVRNAIDLRNGGESITTNAEVMNLVRSIDDGNAWAVGRFEMLKTQAPLPAEIARQLPPIKWVTASGRVGDGIRGVLRAEADNEGAATDLRDVVQGFLALARLETGSMPELQSLLRSVQVSGTGTTVALSFDIPAELFARLAAAARDKAAGDRPPVRP